MDILTDYIEKSFYERQVSLENGFIITIKWNIFRDKKNNNEITMRPRYFLADKNGERVSLKVLNLKNKVKYFDIYFDKQRIREFEEKYIDKPENFISLLFGL